MKPRTLILFITVGCVFLLSCTGMNPRIDIDKSDIQYTKPLSATKMIKGDRVAYELWLDNNKWKIYGSEDAGFVDFRNMQGDQGTGLSHVLKHDSGEAMAVIQEIRAPADFGTLHKALKESLSMGPGSIVDEEIRTVNGSDMLFIKWIEDLGSSKIVWLSYYLSNGTGHMRLAAGTTEQLIAEYEADITELLNGLVDSDTAIPTTVVVVDDIEAKLVKLNKLLKNGLITQKDYDNKKSELLKKF